MITQDERHAVTKFLKNKRMKQDERSRTKVRKEKILDTAPSIV